MDKKEANLILEQNGLGHLKARKIYGWWEIYDTRFSTGFPVKHHALTTAVNMVLKGMRPMPLPTMWREYKELHQYYTQADLDKFNNYNQKRTQQAGRTDPVTKEFIPFVYRFQEDV